MNTPDNFPNDKGWKREGDGFSYRDDTELPQTEDRFEVHPEDLPLLPGAEGVLDVIERCKESVKLRDAELASAEKEKVANPARYAAAVQASIEIRQRYAYELDEARGSKDLEKEMGGKTYGDSFKYDIQVIENEIDDLERRLK